MNQPLHYTVVIKWSDEDRAYVAEVPDLPGCAADGGTYAEAAANVQVVIDEWIQAAVELGRTVPMPDSGKSRYPLRGTVLRYDDPMQPVAEEEWAVLQSDDDSEGQ